MLVCFLVKQKTLFLFCFFFNEITALCLLFQAAFHVGSYFSRALVCPPVRDRVRTKMERDILADVNHPFVVKLHYGESAPRLSLERCNS